jgi:hypothetical protein
VEVGITTEVVVKGGGASGDTPRIARGKT